MGNWTALPQGSRMSCSREGEEWPGGDPKVRGRAFPCNLTPSAFAPSQLLPPPGGHPGYLRQS